MKARAPLILYFAGEDWFFVSHFLSVAAAARAAGFEAAVVTRLRDPGHAETIRAAGVRLIETSHERGHFGPLRVVSHVLEFFRIMRAERPAVVHLISLRLILLGAAAALAARCPRRVHAVTGLGFLGASGTARARAVRAFFGFLLRGPLGGRRVEYVFENPDDPALLGMSAQGPRVTIVGGAGVDAAAFTPEPAPPAPPLRAALVARMVESKGVAVAVEAVRLLRAQGRDVTLSLYGAPDPDNPRSIREATLLGWSRETGVAWRGQTNDIAAVWRGHHIACVPSLGGEGLPRSLLEAAACGRAIVTTDTPGCRSFVRDGVEGFVVPPGDAAALAAALGKFCAAPDLTRAMGEAARARLMQGFTSADVAARFTALYRAMLAQSAP